MHGCQRIAEHSVSTTGAPVFLFHDQGIPQALIDYKAFFQAGAMHDETPHQDWTKVRIFYGFSGPAGRTDGFEVWARRAGHLAQLNVSVFMADAVNGVDLADELNWERLKRSTTGL